MVIARRYHFGAGGIAYAVTTLVLIIGAVNGQNNLLFVVFGAAVAGMLLSGIISGWSMMGLRITREAPGTMRVGEQSVLRYVIENKSSIMPACGLLVEELPKATSAVGFEFTATVEQGLSSPRGAVSRIAARSKQHTETVVLPRKRGRYTLTPMRISSAFPIGLTRKSVTFVQQDAVLVWPARVHLPLIMGAAAPTGDERGSGAPTRAGAEFFSLREYQDGDSPRSIAWRVSARTQSPVVKTFITPPGSRSWIVIDFASVSPALPATTTLAASIKDQPSPATQTTDRVIEDLIALTAGCAQELLSQSQEVGVRSAGGDVLVPLCRGLGSVPSMLDTLALLDATKHLLASNLSQLPRGSLLWICHQSPSVPLPAHAKVIAASAPHVRAALQSSPAVIEQNAGSTSAFGLPSVWFGSLFAEARAWFVTLVAKKPSTESEAP
jgi:uncharacterized protein (DUF58 family)